MTDEQLQIRLLKEKLQAERIKGSQTRNYLVKHHPEVYTEVHNYLQDKAKERANRIMNRIGKLFAKH
jgi:hypothetical protein